VLTGISDHLWWYAVIYGFQSDLDAWHTDCRWVAGVRFILWPDRPVRGLHWPVESNDTWVPITTICGSWMTSEPTVLNTSCNLLITGIRLSIVDIQRSKLLLRFEFFLSTLHNAPFTANEHRHLYVCESKAEDRSTAILFHFDQSAYSITMR